MVIKYDRSEDKQQGLRQRVEYIRQWCNFLATSQDGVPIFRAEGSVMSKNSWRSNA